MIDFGRVEVLTFDCYGTLIDWEQGIVNTLRPLIPAGTAGDETLLESYAGHESRLEAGEWRPYRDVLVDAMSAVCSGLGVEVSPADAERFGRSVVDWPPFPDSRAALKRLAERFELGVITNCDDDLFATSNAKLGEPFRWIVTAEQARSYKPSRRNFDLALERIGRPLDRIVHVAQSLFHDHAPAQSLGLRTVWVNRRAGKPGAGATPVATAVPDAEVPDMAALAELAAAPQSGR